MNALARIRKIVLFVFVATVLAACSGSGPEVTDRGPSLPEAAPVDLTGTETFDASKYDVAPPPLEGAIEHDVPSELMSGELGSSKSFRTVSGFRIQIHSSLDKDEAVSKEQQAGLWWRTVGASRRPAGLGGDQLPVYMHFQQPYYRVRIGNFGTRTEAEEALALVQEAFPNAFIAVDTVSVYR